MDRLLIFSAKDINKITNHRSGEVKFGERVKCFQDNVFNMEELTNSEARYVLLGLPEDIGVKANFGRVGAATAFKSTLASILNFQHNKFCKGDELFILGELNFEDLMKESLKLDPHSKLDRKRLFDIVSLIDKEVANIVSKIVLCKKIPIIIGGGHNNAYGNIKGVSLALGRAINVVNFDAHTDFRIMEGRHSGNAFSYAFEEGFLNKYFIFGFHENLVSKSVFNSIKNVSERIKYATYEEMSVRKEKNFNSELSNALKFISGRNYGVEVDLDAIPGIYSSAMSLSGFSVEKARQFIHFMGSNPHSSYLHICEGAPELDHSANKHLTGKLTATMILDFIKSKNQN